MKSLAEIEAFLASETKNGFDPYPLGGTFEEKQNWIVLNGTRCKTTLFRMRGLGKLAWNNFLWAHMLQEEVVLIRVTVPVVAPEEPALDKKES